MQDLPSKLRPVACKAHLMGLMKGSRMSSTREKTPRTTQYLSQAPALSGDPCNTALRDMKAG